jgi:ABC-2 type transport system permease protein
MAQPTTGRLRDEATLLFRDLFFRFITKENVMSTLATASAASARTVEAPSPSSGAFPAFVTLFRRRFALTVRTPRELFVPLLTPILFALVIAPALKVALHTGVAYESFVAIGTIGLLIPLNTMFSGISVIIDRESGARRELLAAPIPRGLLVLGNLAVALTITTIQLAALIGAAFARGIDFHASATGVVWFVAASACFAIGMYGVAETLANRVPKQEEYISRLPAVAILPWFLAGSLFPIGALPSALTWIAKFLPLTHGLALMRYGLLDDSTGLHNIWGMHSVTGMAALSLAVVAFFAAALTAISIRVFTRAAVN